VRRVLIAMWFVICVVTGAIMALSPGEQTAQKFKAETHETTRVEYLLFVPSCALEVQ
jgi:hypothetical protein